MSLKEAQLERLEQMNLAAELGGGEGRGLLGDTLVLRP